MSSASSPSGTPSTPLRAVPRDGFPDLAAHHRRVDEAHGRTHRAVAGLLLGVATGVVAAILTARRPVSDGSADQRVQD